MNGWPGAASEPATLPKASCRRPWAGKPVPVNDGLASLKRTSRRDHVPASLMHFSRPYLECGARKRGTTTEEYSCRLPASASSTPYPCFNACRHGSQTYGVLRTNARSMPISRSQRYRPDMVPLATTLSTPGPRRICRPRCTAGPATAHPSSGQGAPDCDPLSAPPKGNADGLAVRAVDEAVRGRITADNVRTGYPRKEALKRVLGDTFFASKAGQADPRALGRCNGKFDAFLIGRASCRERVFGYV